MGCNHCQKQSYQHYTADLSTDQGILHQVWSIRLNEAGSVFANRVSHRVQFIPVGFIKEAWIERGLIDGDLYPSGWMAFLETQGQHSGNPSNNNGIGYFHDLWLPSQWRKSRKRLTMDRNRSGSSLRWNDVRLIP